MNYKIKVNNEAESKEVQGYFEELGAVCCSGLERNKNVNFLFMESDFLTACKLKENFDKSKCKEITLPELRDLVVLKRNDATDCTHWHVTGQANLPYLFAVDEWYFFGRNGWEKSTHTHEFYNRLKPIEKPMKEYLNKETHEFVRSHSELNDMWIEIPEGRNFAYKHNAKRYIYFLENQRGFTNHELVWKRETLNDQVASAEMARQESKEWGLGDYDFAESDTLIESNVEQAKHNHYYIDVSNVNEVDFYEIALRYNVTDPCIQHILKKCLAVGNRGHKDFHTDLKDIYDTAKRALDIHKVDQ